MLADSPVGKYMLLYSSYPVYYFIDEQHDKISYKATVIKHKYQWSTDRIQQYT